MFCLLISAIISRSIPRSLLVRKLSEKFTDSSIKKRIKIPVPCIRPFSHSFCFKSISSPPSFIFFLRFFRKQYRAVKRCACLSEKVDQWYSKQPVMEITMILAHISANTLNGFTDIPTHTYTKRPLLLLFDIFVFDAGMRAEKNHMS